MASRAERQAGAARRRAQIVQARMAGTTFEEIGRQHGISDTRAHQLYADAMRRTVKEPADQHRALELRRLDDLQLRLTEVLRREHVTISGGKVVVDADGRPYLDDGPVIAAVQALVRVQESRRRLLGLDEPARADVTARIHAELYSVDALDRELERVERELAEHDPGWAADQQRRRTHEQQLQRFQVRWSGPGEVRRNPAGFVGEALDLCLQGLDLDDAQREQAALEVERLLWNRADR
jgi:hypothetical protein